MKRCKIGWFVALWSVVGSISIAKAAQDLVIRAPNTPVLAFPKTGSSPITQLPVGTVVKASNTARDGFYKILLPKPEGNAKFGWVHQSQVSLRGNNAKPESSGRPMARKTSIEFRKWRLIPFFGVGYLGLGNIATLGGDTSSSAMAIRFGGELSYATSESLRFAVQIDSQSFSKTFQTASDTSTITNIYSLSGLTFLGAIHYRFLNRLPFRMWIGLFAGLSMGQALALDRVISTPDSDPKGFTTTLTAPVMGAKLSAEYVFSSLLSAHLRLGYRYALTNTINLSALSLANVTATMGGLEAEIGPSLSF